MWLSTTGAGLGQPSTKTHRSEDSFRHPPTHRDLRRVKRPARAVPSRSPRSPRVRAKARLPRSVEEIRGETNQARLDFAALRVPKHSVQRHATRDTTNVPTSPLPPPPLVSEKLIKRAEARESPRTWVNPPKARAAPPTPTPAIVTPALTPPPVVQSEPFSPNTKKSLLSVVKALDAGLAAYSLRKGQHVRVGTSWRRFFELVDEDHSGRLTFDELASAVLGGTLRCKDLSRYDLRVFFSKADDDASGEVTEKEFTSLIYTVQLSNWPDIGNAQCDAAVDTLNKAASHWYNCSGNWYKIFKALDVDDSGELRYDDFAAAVRGSYPPGVDVSSKTLPTATLKGLWKRLDADRSQTVSLQEFMVFFRRHGAQHSMYQPTAHDKELRGLNEAPAPPPFIEESDANVWTTLRLLMRTFASNNRKARQYSKPDIWRDWARLFDVLGGPDRATWSSFKTAAKTLTEINDHALGALWTKADRDQSGEVGRGEFQRCAYTIQVQSWPVLEGDDLTKTVATLNAAAERLHRCGGNWFKIFRLFDDDDSGLMSYEELRKVLRSAYPGLEVSSNDVTDDQVRGLWRGLDDDRSGEASVQEFMIFFRRHGAAHSMFTKPMEAPRLKEDAEVEKVALKPERLRAIVLDLKRALHTYFKRRGMAPKLGEEWKVFFNLVDEDQSGRLDAAELEKAVAVLRVSLSDEDLRGLFACADEDGSGEVTTQEFQHCVYKLELETLRAAWDMIHFARVNGVDGACTNTHLAHRYRPPRVSPRAGGPTSSARRNY